MNETGRNKMKKQGSKIGPSLPEILAGRLEKEGYILRSARAAPGTAAFIICKGDAEIRLFLTPKSDNPAYRRTAFYNVRYEGGNRLTPSEQRVLDRAVDIIRSLEAGHGGRVALWPAASATKAGRTGEATPGEEYFGNEPVTINRWTDAKSGDESLEVTVRLTNECNQRCVFCQVRGNRWDTSERFIKAAILKYGRSGIGAKLNLSGGEPTLNAGLPEYARIALGLPYTRVVVQTNAVRLAEKGLVAAFPKSDRLQFYCSFHGFNERDYSFSTGTRGNFGKAVKGVNNLLEAEHFVMLNLVVTSRNLSRLPDMVKLAPDLFPGNRARLELNLSALGRFNSISQNMDLIPYMTDVYRVSRSAIREGAKVGLVINDFQSSGLCTLPVCVLAPGHRRKIVKKMANFQGTSGPEMIHYGLEKARLGGWIKRDECRDCTYDRWCPGVTGEYAIKYGLGELKPVKG